MASQKKSSFSGSKGIDFLKANLIPVTYVTLNKIERKQLVTVSIRSELLEANQNYLGFTLIRRITNINFSDFLLAMELERIYKFVLLSFPTGFPKDLTNFLFKEANKDIIECNINLLNHYPHAYSFGEYQCSNRVERYALIRFKEYEKVYTDFKILIERDKANRQLLSNFIKEKLVMKAKTKVKGKRIISDDLQKKLEDVSAIKDSPTFESKVFSNSESKAENILNDIKKEHRQIDKRRKKNSKEKVAAINLKDFEYFKNSDFSRIFVGDDSTKKRNFSILVKLANFSEIPQFNILSKIEKNNNKTTRIRNPKNFKKTVLATIILLYDNDFFGNSFSKYDCISEFLKYTHNSISNFSMISSETYSSPDFKILYKKLEMAFNS